MSRYACTYFCGLMLTEVDVELPLQLPVGVALGVLEKAIINLTLYIVSIA